MPFQGGRLASSSSALRSDIVRARELIVAPVPAVRLSPYGALSRSIGLVSTRRRKVLGEAGQIEEYGNPVGHIAEQDLTALLVSGAAQPDQGAEAG